MKDNINPENLIIALWCYDSETSEKCLIDLKTSKILLRLPKNSDNLEDNKPSIKCIHENTWFERTYTSSGRNEYGMHTYCIDCGEIII